MICVPDWSAGERFIFPYRLRRIGRMPMWLVRLRV